MALKNKLTNNDAGKFFTTRRKRKARINRLRYDKALGDVADAVVFDEQSGNQITYSLYGVNLSTKDADYDLEG